MTITKFTCSVCKKDIVHEDEVTTGYGLDSNDNKVCFSCCAKQDYEYMLDHDKIVLCLVTDKNNKLEVINWPGTLRFPVVSSRKGKHNIARTQTTVYFRGPNGMNWIGRQYGENTQICHCRRIK